MSNESRLILLQAYPSEARCNESRRKLHPGKLRDDKAENSACSCRAGAVIQHPVYGTRMKHLGAASCKISAPTVPMLLLIYSVPITRRRLVYANKSLCQPLSTKHIAATTDAR